MTGWSDVEQHKVLLIIVSVAVVLAAVVGVGLWLFYPRAADDAALAQNAAPESGGYEWQPLDYLQGQGDVPGLDEGAEGPTNDSDEFEVTYGVVPGAETPLTTVRSTVIDTAAQLPATDGAGTTGAGDQSTPGSAAAVTTAMDATPDARASSTGAGVSSVADSASRVVATTAPSTVAAVAGPELADQAYWIQAISSPHRDTVEQSQLTLREHQLGSRILTKVIDDQTYYRRRIGPFAVRAEAEKFLGWVQDINDFADAMIFVDYTTPVVAARPN